MMHRGQVGDPHPPHHPGVTLLRPGSLSVATSELRSAGALLNARVRNLDGEPIGRIADLMFDLDQGMVAYAVLAVEHEPAATDADGPAARGSKRFAIPWNALRPGSHHELVLDIASVVFERAPGFASTPPADATEWGWGHETRPRIA